jgi:programmed cell death 6-interacting protein
LTIPRFDAFTQKPTSQYSLAFEKASVIFNISAVLSCHAAAQNRAEDTPLKTAYHSFQASAGMFTYINENFLHAPSQDLNRETVKALININLAQAQESFIEKQVRDGKKPALIAKLASQAHYLYSQAKEELDAEASKGVFEPTWPKLVQIKTLHFHSVAEYYQALTEEQENQHGSAIARLGLADKSSKQAYTLAKSYPSVPPPASNLGSDTGSTLQAMTKRQMETVQEKVTSSIKDNDFIYHQTVPAEAALQPVSKMPAAKPIPVSELYGGQDIQKIIGPDIFQKIVPMSVTESASMYDEEKAKLIRSEAEKVEQANGEMAASLDYLKLPNSLNVLKGGMDQEMSTDPEFERWCREISSHEPFDKAFNELQKDKASVIESLAKSSKQLDMEESVCEKMRSKYGGEWTQQPSSRLTSTLRSDIRNYRETVDQAAGSDSQLLGTARQYEADFDEMRGAGERGEADMLYQQSMIKAGSRSERTNRDEGNLLDEDYGEGGPSVADQINKVEELLKKLNLVKRDRMQVLKDLKEKIHTDDISNILILNKKAIANQETQLFQAELEKFRSHQNRLIATVHKQSSLLKELTKTYGDLLQDKRVRSDQQRYDGIQKSRNTVLHRYRKIFNAHEDLIQGLMRAQGFYSEMKESVDSLEKNVETFVSNRRAEGAQLLSQIEQSKSVTAGGQAAAEQKRMQELMERLSMDPKSPQSRPQTMAPMQSAGSGKSPLPQSSYGSANPDPRFTIPPRESPAPVGPNGYSVSAHSPVQPQPQNVSPIDTSSQQFAQGAAAPINSGYNPMMYPDRNITSPISPNGPQQHPAFSPVSSPPPGAPSLNTFFQYPGQNPPSAQPQSGVQLNFTSPTSQHHHFSFPTYSHQHQPQHPGPQPSPGHQYTTFAAAYGMPQNYVPPPPPPGPPGGGSTTQYPPNTGQQWASGPGGYASYSRPGMPMHNSAGTGHGSVPSASTGHAGSAATGYGSSAGSGAFMQHPQQQQQGQGQQDPWAGLSAWK